MTTKVFNLTDWFMDRNENWDCSNLYLILLPDGRIETMPRDNEQDREKMETKYPNARIMCDLTKDKGRLESGPKTNIIKLTEPSVWLFINTWCKFLERQTLCH
jgi:hypothetical protein